VNEIRNIKTAAKEAKDALQNTKELLKNNKSDSNIEMSPEMGELSFDQVFPPAPPAPPAPPIAPTNTGMPSELLNALNSKNKLKPVETIVKDGLNKGKLLDEDNNPVASSSKSNIINKDFSLKDALSNKLEKFRKVMGDDSDNSALEKGTNILDDPEYVDFVHRSAATDFTPRMEPATLDPISEKGKEKEISPAESESSPDEMGKYFKKVDTSLVNTLIEKSKDVKSLDHLNNHEKDSIIKKYQDTNTDILINSVKNLPESLFKDDLIISNVNQNIKNIIDANKGLNKQEIMELYIKENPGNVDQILPIISFTLNEEIKR
jgi:hypothetical protein